MKKVTLTITDVGKIIVIYDGLWTRKDIERVSVAMLKELPINTASYKKKLDIIKKEKEDERAGRISVGRE